MVLAAGILYAGRPDEGRRQKAEYIFLESINAYEDDRFDDFLMLLRRAHRLDPSDPYIAGNLAELEVVLPSIDSVGKAEAYEALKRRFLVEPSNEYYAKIFSSIALGINRLDDVIMVWSTLDSLQPSRTDPAMNLARAYQTRYLRTLDIDDYNRAIDIYRRLQQGVGHSPSLSAPKIGAFLLRNDTVAVVDELRAVERDAPADPGAMMFVGAVFEHINMPDSALTYYDRAARLDPEDGQAYVARAALYQSRGDSVAYDREVFRALESPGLPFEDKMGMLSGYVKSLYTDSVQWPRIEEMFALLQNLNPGEAQLHDYYAAYNAATGRTLEAAEQLSYSADLDPMNFERYLSMSQLYFQVPDYDKVIATTRRGMRFFPAHPQLMLVEAVAYGAKNDDLRGIAVLDSIEPTDDKALNGRIYSTKADFYSRIEQIDSARVYYRKAIENDAENYMAMNNLAYFNAEAGEDLDVSELYASIAVQSDPQNTTYIDTYAWVFFKKKDFARARQEIDKILKIFKLLSDDGETFKTDINITDISADEADDLIEDESTQEAIVISSDVLDHAGDIYFMTGEPKKALELWKLALRLDADNEKIKKKVEFKTIFLDED